jgi:hypothetical protein
MPPCSAASARAAATASLRTCWAARRVVCHRRRIAASRTATFFGIIFGQLFFIAFFLT